MFGAPVLTESFSATSSQSATPSATPGTTITAAGSVNTKGSYTSLLSALSDDADGIFVRISDAAVASATRDILVDIGYDPAGGTSYSVLVPDLNGGNAPPIAIGCGQLYFFPIRIPAGSTIAARSQCSTASGTCRVQVKVYRQSSHLESWPSGSIIERIGAITGSRGVSFTPGNAANGSWVSLGTLSRACRWINFSAAVTNTAISAERTYVDLAVGDGSNKRILSQQMIGGTTAEQVYVVLPMNLLWLECYHALASGAELWVRGRCENAPDSGYHALAYAMG